MGQSENGYNIYTFQGKNIVKQMKDRFYQFLWRPRPPSLLSQKQEKDIKKRLKEFSEKYRKEDILRKEREWQAFLAKLSAMRNEFEAFQQTKQDIYQKELRIERRE